MYGQKKKGGDVRVFKEGKNTPKHGRDKLEEHKSVGGWLAVCKRKLLAARTNGQKLLDRRRDNKHNRPGR